MKKNKDTFLILRLTTEDKNALAAMAAKSGRKMSDYIFASATPRSCRRTTIFNEKTA